MTFNRVAEKPFFRHQKQRMSVTISPFEVYNLLLLFVNMFVPTARLRWRSRALEHCTSVTASFLWIPSVFCVIRRAKNNARLSLVFKGERSENILVMITQSDLGFSCFATLLLTDL